MSNAVAIDLLSSVVRHPACQKMNLSTVKGYLGELIVKHALEMEGRHVEHLGNQSGYDLKFSHQGREIRVDVKMSTLKNEFGWGFEYWGWALRHENKKKEISATHFVCVGCSRQLELQSVFVISASQLSLFPCGEKQFSKVKHGLVLAPTALGSEVEPRSVLYQQSQSLLASGVVRQVASGSSISDACVWTQNE